MKKKVIGITSNVVSDIDVPYFDHCKLIRVFSDYSDSVIKAGAIPIIIPFTTDKNVLNEYMDIIDGLIVTGGYDIDPLRYNEEPHEKLEGISLERDLYEFHLVEKAIEKNIPILGICRGHQLLNVVYGGTLYQDISLIKGANLKHRQQGLCHFPTHSISVKKGTKLFEVLGDKAMVNSFHHLAVKDVASGFVISATSKDGVVEAIEKVDGNFVMGVQWHPECLTKNSEDMLKLFAYFIEKCK
ncbi:MAG: gamma-glutamyl-gamma-aminobutyrate hydrolase family protein [Sarcina sp.]